MNPEQVKALQTRLRAQGLYDGPIDGIMGPKMQSAIAASQAQNNQSEIAKANAQAEAAKAQAEAAKAQAISGEAARLKAETEAKDAEARRTKETEAGQTLKTYQQSTLGQAMGGARTLAPFLGVGAGYGDTLMARKFLGVNEGPLVAGPGKRLALLAAFGVPIGVAGGLGHYAENQASDPNNTHFQHDLDLAAANLGYGMAGGNMTGGVFTAGKDIMKPGALGASSKPPEAVKDAAQESVSPELPPNAQKAIDAARAVGAKGDLTHADAMTFIKGRLANDDLPAAERSALRDALKMTSPQHTFRNALKKIAPGMAAFPVLYGAMTGGGSRAEAGPLTDPASEMAYAPRDRSAISPEYNAPGERFAGLANALAKGAADSAPYFVPGAAMPLMTRDLAALSGPADRARNLDISSNPQRSWREQVSRDMARENLANATAEDLRQRQELALKRAQDAYEASGLSGAVWRAAQEAQAANARVNAPQSLRGATDPTSRWIPDSRFGALMDALRERQPAY